MKKVTLLLIAIIIASVGIVVAKISNQQEVKAEQVEEVKPVLTANESDVSSWD